MQKLLDQQQLTLRATQQIEKFKEQLQLTYIEESSENELINDISPTNRKNDGNFVSSQDSTVNKKRY